MSETLCPNCGHSPIPLHAECCPECGEPFTFLQAFKRGQRVMTDRMMDHVDIEPTTNGQVLTGELSAHPAPAAALLLAGAVAWFLRCTQALGPTADPLWVLGLAGMNLVLVLMLVLNLGPIRALIKAGMLLQVGLALGLSGDAPFSLAHLAYAAHAAVCFALAVGEPTPKRRRVSLWLGMGMIGVGVLMRAVGGAQYDGEPGVVTQGEQGYRLQLPGGWSQLPPGNLPAHLALPEGARHGEGASFGHERAGRYGALWVEPQGGQALTVGCKTLLQALVPEALSTRVEARRAPAALGPQSELYEVRTPDGGDVGFFACGHLADGRRAGLVVVVDAMDLAGAEQTLWMVGTGLSWD
jgi:hypothetical protein